MLATPFTPVTNCPLSSAVVSSTITISAADNGKSLSVQGGSAVVNGVAVTSFPVTLHTGDTLAITTTSSSSNDTATFVPVTFGGQQYIVTFVTASPYSNIFDTDMYAVPFYQRKFTDGSLYDSTVHTYSVAINGAVTEKQTTATPSGITDTTYQLMLLDPYNDEAHLVGSNGVLVKTFDIPDATWTGATVYNVGKFLFWFGFFRDKKVGITIDGETFTYITLPASPVAIATTLNGNYVWVACYDGSIYCYQNVGPLTFTQVAQVKLNSTPTSIAVDDAYNVYAVSMSDTIVSKFSTAGSLLGTTSVGNMPTGITYASGQLYVSCAEDQSVVALNATTLARTGAISLTEFPGLITIDPTNSYLCVTCLSSPNVYRFKTDSTLAQVDKTTFSKPVLAAYSFGTTIVADHLQYDARPYTRSYNSTVPGLGFFENDQEPISTSVKSTTVTVTELEVAVPINIPAGLGASIVLNGTNIGTSGTVHNNDQFYITFTTPSTQQTFIQIPVSVGNYVEPWNSTTAVIMTAPNPFYFDSVTTAANQLTQTPVITIGGLTPGTFVSVSTSAGTLLKNGVTQSGPFTVTNGDTIQLQLTSSGTVGASVRATVTAGSFATTWNVYTSVTLTPMIQVLTGQALSTTVTSNTWIYNKTVIDPITHQPSPTSTTIIFPAGVVVKVNGVIVSTGATISTGDQIVVSGTTATQYAQTSTFVATTIDGYIFELQATTIANVVPYPMDFGVIYDAAPGGYYETQDVTVQNINASALLALHSPGSFLLGDGDTGAEQLTVSNGAVVGLNIRGQASAHNLMYTVPVYAVGNDGSTLVQVGSARVVPMILKGSIDYPYEGREEVNNPIFFRYKEGVYLEANLPAAKMFVDSPIDTGLEYGWIYELDSMVESELQYGWTFETASVAEAALQYSASSYMSTVLETGYTPTWNAYVAAATSETQYVVNAYSYAASSYETSYQTNWYYYKPGTVSKVTPTIVYIKYPDYHVTNAMTPSAINQVISNSKPVRPKYVNVKNSLMAKVKATAVNNKIGIYTPVAPRIVGNINNTIGKWNMSTNIILPGYWLSGMPIPEMIDHIKILANMPTSFIPPGCQHGYQDMPSAVYDFAEMVEANAPQPTVINSSVADSDGREAMSVDDVSSFEFGTMNTQVTIVATYEFNSNQAVSYNEEVTTSVQDPTLFGGFATQAAANQFVTDNNLQSAHVYQLSNGYWVVITDVTQDLACAIAPSTGLRAIGWLLQGG